MAKTQSRTDVSLTLRRTVQASRDKVFRAWTDPAVLRQWFAPEGYAVPTAELDLTVGGRYRIVMAAPDGGKHVATGTYREIRRPERLVFTWQWEDAEDPAETLVTVQFHDRGAATEVVLTHERFPNEEDRDKHEEGWSSVLNRLPAAVGS